MAKNTLVLTISKFNVVNDMTALEKEVQRIIKEEKPDDIVIDLKGLSFVVSSALTQMIKLSKFAKKNKIGFKVINAGKIYDTLVTLKLTNVFEVTK